MNARDVDEFLNREPFVAFRLILTSGTTYDVMSPMQLVVEQGKLSFYYSRSDRVAVLRLNQLAAIETLE